ncbi:SDR family NAD(P)-dependent oxidoreductase [Phenylobacterium sp.]|uniref:SDR family NAD(P)-dependent oxidoreductase n=1 Tax=Phenylobacterium sp. TaxID=1871053 RepID=UPI002730CCC6|nr:SDR family NAD(P)-dependent oxidoreductase [Phenylobacterium sp.]MDP1874404.1 SDR family NAD(P)-dependent oxidoreductase [Phenylobacterium sp.]MDP3489435.1 SDR family NAD(P)-dependent oxidoreductase [Phenylobacterium sp.]
MGLLDGKVAIVTGAGGGLGEAYAKLFAKEGAKVVVNDLGGTRDGSGADRSAAQKVVDEIKEAGGEAVANGDDVSTVEGGENILKTALDTWGKIDILVCNAGILRDKTFANTSEADWDLVVKVHLKGTYCCAWPVWKWMKENNNPGVMVLTSSTSGLYGNFGQANYGAAKAGIYGLMRVLSIEGRKYGIRVMGLAPGAFTRMTSDLPGRQGKEPDAMSLPENIAPGVLYMVSDLAADHSGKVLGVSSRGVREIKMVQTDGFNPGKPYTAQDVAKHAEEVFFPAAAERTAASA